MNVSDYISIAQGCAITVVFVYLAYNVPGMFSKWVAWKKDEVQAVQAEAQRVRDHDARERAADRQARHDAADKFQKALQDLALQHRTEIAQLVEAMTDLRLAVEGLVRPPAVRPHKGVIPG